MIYHSVAVKLGISDCAFWIFYTLSESEEQCTQSELCDLSSMPRQTVNSALKKLESDGYIALSPAKPKPGKFISLTKKGKEFSQDFIIPVLRAEESACASFTEEEKDMFIGTYRTLVERLDSEISRIRSEEQ